MFRLLRSIFGKPSEPEKTLRNGCRVLDPVLRPHGFRLKAGTHGVGSGGTFASCKYVRGDRFLELHYRYSLGLVSYHVGEASLDHEMLMRMLGVRNKCLFPDFPTEPLDSFRSLARDLELYCSDFLSRSGIEFLEQYRKSKNEKRGLAEIS
jgi:hypothetical protein